MIDMNEKSGVQPASAGRPSPPPAAVSRSGLAEGWVREHGDVLWAFLLSRTRSREIAEEVLQETFLAATQAVDRFASASAQRTWLLGIAVHKLADHFRRTRRDAASTARLQDDSETGAHRAKDAPFGPAGQWVVVPLRWGERPDDAAERTELVAALRECIEALPSDLADALSLRDLLGMPSDEVCMVLGLSPTNLWKRTHRARSFLRLCVETKIGVRKEDS